MPTNDLYISRATACHYGAEMVRNGAAKSYRVKFVQTFDVDTREIMTGYRLILV